MASRIILQRCGLGQVSAISAVGRVSRPYARIGATPAVYSFASRRHNSTVTEAVSSAATNAATATTAASTEVATNVAHAIGDLKLAGLASSWTPVGWVQQGLEALHVSTGLPWWASIAVMTVGIRTLMLPLVIKLQRDMATLANIKPELDAITAEMQKAKVNNDNVKLQQSARAAQDLFTKHNTHPLKALGMPLLQAPIMISFFLALRKMSEANVDAFQNGGFGWVTDLTVADPYYVLPLVASAGFLVVLEIGAETGTTAATAAQRNFFRGMGLLMIPFTAGMPASVFMYWITSNIFTIGQALVLRNPDVRDRLRLPQVIKHQNEFTRLTGAPEKMGFVEGFKAAYSAGRSVAQQTKPAGLAPNGAAPDSRDVVKAALAKK
ncbi:hypothetical protein RI367_006925 [Sorochytrium milnesiophthora]